VAQLFADMAITISCCGVVDVCLTDTRSDASGLFLNQAEAQQMFQSTVIATGLKSDRADIGSFSTVAERKILLATVGWSVGPRRVKRSTTIDSRRAPGC